VTAECVLVEAQRRQGSVRRKRRKLCGMAIVPLSSRGFEEMRTSLALSGRPVFESSVDELLTSSLENRWRLCPEEMWRGGAPIW
jgi:hypothetical protein